MEIKVLGCFGGNTPDHLLTSFLINNTILLDAGSATRALSIEEQGKIRAIILSHSHLDHVFSIPFLADNMNTSSNAPIEIISHSSVITPFKDHILNDMIWPDFTQIPHSVSPVLSLKEIEEGKEFHVHGLKATAVKVSHVIPTYGYLLKDENATIVYTGDTGPTQKIWDAVNNESNMKAIITEISYPNSLSKLAHISRHLTPALFAEEIKKIKNKDIPIYIYHMKPQHQPEIEKEVTALNLKNTTFLEQGKTYTF